MVDGSTSMPLYPVLTISGIPAIFVEIIGKDNLIASRIDMGNPSSLLGRIKMSLAIKYWSTLFVNPLKDI